MSCLLRLSQSKQAKIVQSTLVQQLRPRAMIRMAQTSSTLLRPSRKALELTLWDSSLSLPICDAAKETGDSSIDMTGCSCALWFEGTCFTSLV